MTDQKDMMMTPEEVALMLAISVQEVTNLLGKPSGIPAFNLQGKKRVWRSSVMAWLDRQQVVAKEEEELVKEAEASKDTLIVSKQYAIVEWLATKGIVAPHLREARADDVINLNVIGPVTYFTGSMAKSVTVMHLRYKTSDMKGRAWTIKDVEKTQPAFYTYEVKRLPDMTAMLQSLKNKNPYEQIVIMTGNTDFVSWLNSIGIYGQVLSRATPHDVEGKYVIGDAQYHIAAHAQAYIDLHLSKQVPSYAHYRPLCASEIAACGPSLYAYKVTEVAVPFPSLRASAPVREERPARNPVERDWQPGPAQRPLSQTYGYDSKVREPRDLKEQIEQGAARNGNFRVTRNDKDTDQ